MAADPELLSRPAVEALTGGAQLTVSTPNAFEYADLQARGRFGPAPSLAELVDRYALEVDLPPDAWRVAADLPRIHRDPVDRMMIAHAMAAGLPVVSADTKVAKYAITTIW